MIDVSSVVDPVGSFSAAWLSVVGERVASVGLDPAIDLVAFEPDEVADLHVPDPPLGGGATHVANRDAKFVC